jgi:hypothetical protein
MVSMGEYMGASICGCGEPTENGRFIAGRSQKPVAGLVKEIGGLKEIPVRGKGNKGVLRSYPANLSCKGTRKGSVTHDGCIIS